MPSAIEKRFVDNVAWIANMTPFMSVAYGKEYADHSFHIHHVVGREAKKKVDLASVKIGGFYCLPVPVLLHDVHSNHPLNVTHHKKEFERAFGTQKELYGMMIQFFVDYGRELPPDNVLRGIL